MKTSDQIDQIATALAKAQGALKPAIKDATNPAFRSKYADLAALWEQWREVGPVNGLALIQEPVTVAESGAVRVTTRLMHTSGQWIEFDPLEVPMDKPTAHGVGSATSYGKRYAMGGACGIVAEEDDDGNAAVGNGQRKIPGYYQRKPEPTMARPQTPQEAQEYEEKAWGAAPPEKAAQKPAPARTAAIETGVLTRENIEERAALLTTADALANELGLSSQETSTIWMTYCGGATRKNVAVAALRELVAFLNLRLDQRKAS